MKYLPVIFLFILFPSSCTHRENQLLNTQTIELDSDWTFRQSSDANWLPATVPGTVHTDLLDNGIIDDPYYRTNEKKLQWIDKSDWEYQCSFVVDKGMRNKEEIEMVFEGLDTYAEIYLNGKLVLQTDNMFRKWKVPCKELLKKGKHVYKVKFEIPDLKLWWPNGLGEPNLYAINVNLYNQSDPRKPLLDQRETLIGVKTIRLVQEKDTESDGQSFYFEVNGHPVFAKGANYIPNDVFLTRFKPEDYERIVKDAADANMNMLCVWGGGIYENDIFYDLCDKYGIMVWQDFMYACSMYPGDDEFLENARIEAEENIKRLRNHPSLALWCGNNEIEVAWGEYKARFMSEYGFQSFPELNTVASYALPEEWDIESEVMAAHQRSGIGSLTIAGLWLRGPVSIILGDGKRCIIL